MFNREGREREGTYPRVEGEGSGPVHWYSDAVSHPVWASFLLFLPSAQPRSTFHERSPLT